MQRFFGEVEIAEEANERGEHAAGIGVIDSVDCFADVVNCGRAHPSILSDLEPAAQARVLAVHSLACAAGFDRFRTVGMADGNTSATF